VSAVDSPRPSTGASQGDTAQPKDADGVSDTLSRLWRQPFQAAGSKAACRLLFSVLTIFLSAATVAAQSPVATRPKVGCRSVPLQLL